MFLSLLLMYGKEVVKVCHDETEGFLARDPQAFEELINQYKAYVLRLFYVLLMTRTMPRILPRRPLSKYMKGFNIFGPNRSFPAGFTGL